MNDMTSPECRSDREITQAVSASQDEDVTVPKEAATKDDVAGAMCGRGQLVVNVPQHSGGDFNIGGEVNTTHNELHQHIECHGTIQCRRLVQNIFVGYNGDQEAREERSEAVEETPTVRAESPSFVETDHLTEAECRLEERRRVVLCGPPGSGKTTLGHALLAHCKGFRPSAVSNVSELSVRIGGKGEIIVLMDGVLGEVRVDERECRALRAVLRSVLDSIKVGKCRLVLTMYPHIIREIRSSDLYSFSSLIQSTDVIEIQAREINEEQKRAMLEMHFRELHLETDSQDALVTQILQKDVSGAAFPWCCRQMVNNWQSMSDPTVFFVAPSESHVPLLQRMLHNPEHGEAFAVVLSLRMWGLGCFLHNPGQMRSRLESLGFRDFSPDRLKEYAHILQGSILNENGDSFQNRVVYDAVGLALGRSSRLHVLLKVCDVRFLVQHVRTKETATEFSVAIGTNKGDRQLLMQTMYEHIVGGRLPEVCQHPSLHCPQFLQEFEAFCRERENYVQVLASAVDPVHRMPLLYWSIWGPSGHLTEWCLKLFDAETDMTVLTDVCVKSAFVIAVLEDILEMDTTRVPMARHALQYVMTRSENMTGEIRFPLPSDEQCITDDMQASKTRVREHVQSGTYNSFQSASFSVSDSQISMRVSDDAEAVRVLVSCQDLHLALTGLVQGEAEQRDEGNRLLHVAADSGDLDAVKISAESDASRTNKDTSNQRSSELEATLRNGTHNNDSFVQQTVENPLHSGKNAWFESETESVVSTEEFAADGSRAVAERSVDKDHRAEQYSADYQPFACDERGGQSLADNREYQPVADNNRAEQPVAGGVRAEKPAMRTTMRLKHVTHFFMPFFVVVGALVIPVFINGNYNTFLLTSLAYGYRQMPRFLTELTSARTKFLYWACLNGETETVAQLLLGNNGDTNKKNENGFACIHAAIYNNHTRTARFLIMHGADVNVKGSGITPLYLAAVNGQIEIAKLLIQRGADVKLGIMKEELTMLHLVSESGRTEFAELLIKSNADVNAKTKDGLTPLFYAISHDHLDIVRLLLKNGADVNTRIKHWPSPLFLACAQGRTGIAERLLLKGADINITDGLARTPLHVTCEKKHTETARLLISRSAELHAKDAKGFTPLDYAVMSGDLEIVDLLITRKPQVSSDPPEDYYKIDNIFARMPNEREDSGDTPLHLACSYGQTEIASRLINSTVADIDERNNRRLSPLHQAAHFGHTEIAYLLVQNHADVNARSKDIETPLHLAALSGHTLLTRLLIDNTANVNAKNVHGITPLYYASSAGNTKTARLLINSGADINMEDELGHTPLHMACWHGHTETAQLLIQKGADINMKSSHGNTALHYACSSGFNETAILLIKSGANISVRNDLGSMPVYSACASGHTQIASLLLQRGADITAVDRNGDTPLHVASAKGHTETVRFLIQNKADINALNVDGFSPLHSATKAGHVETALFLIQSNAEVNKESEDGSTPLHFACELGQTETVRALLSRGADINVMNKLGLNPFQCAAGRGHFETARLLLQSEVDVNVKVRYGYTALHFCSMFDRIDSVHFLIQNGADVNIQTDDGITSLHVTGYLGQTETTRILLENHANVHVKDSDGQTPLHCACEFGSTGVARLLTQSGADVGVRDNEGNTPLHLVSMSNNPQSIFPFRIPLTFRSSHGHHTETARLLIERNADVNAKNDAGHTPLHVAVNNRIDKELIRLLVENHADINAKDKFGETALHKACTSDFQKEVVVYLLQNRAGVDIKDKLGETPLHKACMSRFSKENARLLIEHHADVNVNDSLGRTPLHVACMSSSNEETVLVLVQHEADVNARDIRQETPLHAACTFPNNIGTLSILIHHNADINARDHFGRTPAHITSLFDKSMENLRFLIRHGADLNVKDDMGNTPLHDAVLSGKTETVRLLTDGKADVNLVGSIGLTPLHFACFAGNTETALLLLQNNADVNAKAPSGETPLDLAIQQNHTDLVRILSRCAKND